MFTGREAELNYLNSYYDRVGSQIMIVYGEKGIGKTTLLEHFLEKKNYLYYEALNCSTRQQLFYLGEQLRDMGYSMPAYPEYKDIFSVFDREQVQKQILVIDEFQNLCKTDTGFFETLDSYLNREDRNNSLFIVLCSSSIGWVENAMVAKMKGAARKITGFLKVKELKYRDFVKQFPAFSPEDSVGAYSILGGIPALWQSFNDEYTLQENIEDFILQSNEKLFDYGQRYVEEELRETAVYNTILAALAAGMHKLNDLYQHTGFSRAKISVYLKNLMQLEIVEKVFSYDTEGRENTQKGLYQIKHPFVRFYYRYLFPHQMQAGFLTGEEFYEAYIEPTFREYVEPCFTHICREYLDRENACGRLPFSYTSIGAWVGKMGTIDFIAEDGEGNTMAGICNWSKDTMTFADYEWLLFCQEKAKIQAEDMILFSRSTFDEELLAEAEKNPHLVLLSLAEFRGVPWEKV